MLGDIRIYNVEVLGFILFVMAKSFYENKRELNLGRVPSGKTILVFFFVFCL
jgi:hypothetical protein